MCPKTVSQFVCLNLDCWIAIYNISYKASHIHDLQNKMHQYTIVSFDKIIFETNQYIFIINNSQKLNTLIHNPGWCVEAPTTWPCSTATRGRRTGVIWVWGRWGREVGGAAAWDTGTALIAVVQQVVRLHCLLKVQTKPSKVFLLRYVRHRGVAQLSGWMGGHGQVSI